MSRVRSCGRGRKRVRIGASDPGLTPVGGLVAVAELVDRLGVVEALDDAVGAIKTRRRGFGPGELLVGLASAQLAGEDFLVGLDRRRADVVGQAISPVAGLSSTTAAGLARRFTEQRWRGVETGLARVNARMLALVPADRAQRLCERVTIDLDTTDVEVYGRKKRGVAYNHQGQRVGRPHVGTWAEAGLALVADLMSGAEDPRGHAPALLRRALMALPPQARAGDVRTRADAGYFAGDLARAAHAEGIGFAIGAKRIAPLWRCLAGIAESDWTEAIDMRNAAVAVSDYRPKDWPPNTILLVRRVELTPDQVSADPRSRRRRTLHPDQRALPLAELQEAGTIHAYSFVLTNLDVSTPAAAIEVEHWYRHRTEIENVFRDGKHGAALHHLPSGYPEVNTAWMWGALLAANTAAWLHQLTAAQGPDGALAGHGVRDGKAMIATLRRRLVRIPARLIRHGATLTLRPPPGHGLLAEVLARLRALPALS